MRKLLLTVVASCALVAVMPATSLAHGHHHARHHGRIHHKRFGTDFNQSGSSTSGSSTSGSTTSGDTAGTVQSFTNGVLTILLNDQKTTVSGQVTSATEMECGAPDVSSSSGWQGHDHGGDNSGATQGGDNNGGGSQGDDDQGQGDDDNNPNVTTTQSCDTSALTPGTVVREASLSVSSGGATWDKVELMMSSTSTSTSTSPSSSSSSSWGDH